MGNKTICFNCGSGNLTAHKLGIPLRPATARPETEFAVIALICEECGLMAFYGEKQFEATSNWPTTEETDCIVVHHLVHLSSVCDLCCEASWCLGRSILRLRMGRCVLVG